MVSVIYVVSVMLQIANSKGVLGLPLNPRLGGGGGGGVKTDITHDRVLGIYR